MSVLRHDQNGGSLTETFESGADSIINAIFKGLVAMPERLYEREGFTRSSKKYSSFFAYTVSKTISKTQEQKFCL